MRNFLFYLCQVMKRCFPFIVAVLILQSCATYRTGNATSMGSVTQNNFKVLGRVIGSSKSVIFLGLGGGSLKRVGLPDEAMTDLHKNYPLQAGQAYVNTTVNFNNSFWFLGVTSRCNITADVVQFFDEKNPRTDSSSFEMEKVPCNLNQSIKLGKLKTKIVFLGEDYAIVKYPRLIYGLSQPTKFEKKMVGKYYVPDSVVVKTEMVHKQIPYSAIKK